MVTVPACRFVKLFPEIVAIVVFPDVNVKAPVEFDVGAGKVYDSFKTNNCEGIVYDMVGAPAVMVSLVVNVLAAYLLVAACVAVILTKPDFSTVRVLPEMVAI